MNAHTTQHATPPVACNAERPSSEQETALTPAVYTVTEPGGAALSVHGDSDDAFWTAYDAMKSAVARQLWRGQVLLATCVAATKHQPVDAFGSGRGKRGEVRDRRCNTPANTTTRIRLVRVTRRAG